MTQQGAASPQSVYGDLIEADEFFAPAPHGLVDGLMGQYQSMRRRILEVGNLVHGETLGAIGYFISGNADGQARRIRELSCTAQLFKIKGAIAALNADFWQQALALTDVYDMMPQARRDEWNNAILEMETPDFTQETVQTTLQDMLDSREQYFAERIDGIFRGLSGEHVTNQPMGFSKRMILSYVFNDYGSVCHSKAGLINDLRAVVARFMGRDEPRWNMSNRLLEACRRDHGQWHSVDGGAIRVRAYKKGTAHLEIHPDMAWRLNAMLAKLYPRAIPASQCSRPKTRTSKTFKLMQRPLPFAVLEVLEQLRGEGTQRRFDYVNVDKAVKAEAVRVLESIGAVVRRDNGIEFDYDPQSVIDEIITSGCIPDQKSHQFYPTPSALAKRLVTMLDAKPGHRCLEPSAGQGALAALMPKDDLTCVEISELNCQVLREKGMHVVQTDFLDWSTSAWATSGARFDRIAMNPPFSEARALSHLQAAATLLAHDGRLAAILPASMRGKAVLPGYKVEWSEAIDNAFAGTSASVVICVATK